jgi:hypothetical protein
MAFTKGALRASASVAASQTDSAFIPAGTGGVSPQRAVIVSLVIVNGATGTSTLALNSKGSGAGTLLTGFPASFVLPASGQLVLPPSDDGWFDAKPGEAITVSTGAGNTTNAFFIATYRYVY